VIHFTENETKYFPVGFRLIVAERIFPSTSLDLANILSRFGKLDPVSIYFDRGFPFPRVVALTGVRLNGVFPAFEPGAVILFPEKALECVIQMFSGIFQ
jgi:hypothetical protein